MAKNSTEKIKEDEEKILGELINNSKERIEKIAKKCGFSKQKVWKLIRQLEEHHIIWGYTAIVDTKPRGLQKFILSVKRSNKLLDKKIMNEIAYEKLNEIIVNLGATIESSYYIHGDYDWVLIFTAQDIQHAKKFAEILFNAYPGIVDKVNLSQILFIQRDHQIANPDQSKLIEFL